MGNSLYFPHDYSARNDVKCLFLRQQLGMEGYGIFWFLVESLAESGGELPLKIVPVLAMQMQVTEAKVTAVVNHFELFQISDNNFFSIRLNKHLDMRNLLSEQGKKGAVKRWEHRTKNGGAISPANGGAITHPNGDAYANKERKKERDNNINIIIPPKIEDVERVFKQQGGTTEQALYFFNSYEAVNWHIKATPIKDYSKLIGNFIKNWKANPGNGHSKHEPARFTRKL